MDVDPPDVVGQVVFEAAADVERIVLSQAGTLANEQRGAAAALAVETGAQAVIYPGPAFNPVEPRKAVVGEKIGVVELEILAVFVGDVGWIAAVRRHDGLNDGLQNMADGADMAHKRIAPFGGQLGPDPAGEAVIGLARRVAGIDHVVHVIKIAPHRCREPEGVAGIGDVGQVPTRLGRKPPAVGAVETV